MPKQKKPHRRGLGSRVVNLGWGSLLLRRLLFTPRPALKRIIQNNVRDNFSTQEKLH
jgi:hypothetical protein